MLIYLSKKIKNAISIRITRLGDNKTVCSCLTMRKLNRSLVTIIWHIVYWYRCQRLNVWTLGSTFQLACSMGAKYFERIWSASTYLSHMLSNREGLVFLVILGFWFFLGSMSRFGSGEIRKPDQIGLIK